MRFLRTQGFLASALGLVAVAGCGGRGDLGTDLRTEGPPEVTAATVVTDGDITDSAFLPGLGGLPEEIATFCRAGDDFVPTFVGAPEFSVWQVCPQPGTDEPAPEMVTTGSISGRQIRIVFDELLDTSVETLVDSETGGPCTDASETCDGSFATTQPGTITCNGQTVAYDGYYVPNGNNKSYPPGPNLVFIVTDFVATGAVCSVTLRDTITDKTGEVIPADQRGPYSWQIAELAIAATSPDDGDDLAADAPTVISFNAPLDDTTVTGADIEVTDSGGAAVAVTIAVDPGTGDIIITPNAGTWTEGETYTVTVLDTATITDIAGGPYNGGEFIYTFVAVAP